MFEIREGNTSRSSIIIQDYFVPPYEVESYTFKFCKKLHWNFGGD